MDQNFGDYELILGVIDGSLPKLTGGQFENLKIKDT